MPEIDPQLQFAPAAPLPHPTVKQAEEAGAIGGGCTIGSLLRRDIPLAIVTSSQVPYRDLLQSLELRVCYDNAGHIGGRSAHGAFRLWPDPSRNLA